MVPPMTSLLEQGRTHTCGALRDSDVGARVVLFGWVNNYRDHGGRRFVDLRDRDGLTQITFGPDIDNGAHERAQQIRQLLKQIEESRDPRP